MIYPGRKRQVRLYVREGPTIEGVLAGRTTDTYIIWAAKIVTDSEDQAKREVEVGGHVLVPRKQVLYIQVL